MVVLNCVQCTRGGRGTEWDGMGVVPRPVPRISCGTGSGRDLYFEIESRRALSRAGSGRDRDETGLSRDIPADSKIQK